VDAVKRLYLDRLRVGNKVIHEPATPRAEELLLTQAIARAVDAVFERQPERAAAFVNRLDFYERWLKRFKLSDDALVRFSTKGRLLGKSLLRSAFLLVGAPVALYGWVHRLIPVLLVRYAVTFTDPAKRKAQTPHAKIISGIVVFLPCYLVFALVFHSFFGWPASFWYAFSLPVTGLVAYYYTRNFKRLAMAVRDTVVLVRAPFAARRLLKLRNELIAEIEVVRSDSFSMAKGGTENPIPRGSTQA
jgi:hypothetical protein